MLGHILRTSTRTAAAAVTALVVVGQADCYAGGALNYTLDPHDKLQLRVVEYQQGLGTTRDWPALTGTFTIGSGGDLRLPLLGAVPAAGQTTEQLADTIAAALQKRVGMVDRPSVIIDVAEFRPYYVSGAVQRSDEFPFRPGVTVLQALSVAGGSLPDNATWQLSRDLLTYRGDRAQALSEADAARARIARLDAEARGAAEVSFPPDLQAEAHAMLRNAELEAFAARRATLNAKLQSLADQKKLNEDEIEVLTRSADVTQKQIELTAQELKRTKDLLENGLTTAMRTMALERANADLQSRQLDIAARIVVVREQIAKFDQDARDVTATHQAALHDELQQVHAKLRDSEIRATTLQQLIDQAMASGAAAAARFAPTTAPLRVTIHRGERSIPVPQGEDMALAPGDILSVEASSPPPQRIPGRNPPAVTRAGAAMTVQPPHNTVSNCLQSRTGASR